MNLYIVYCLVFIVSRFGFMKVHLPIAFKSNIFLHEWIGSIDSLLKNLVEAYLNVIAKCEVGLVGD